MPDPVNYMAAMPQIDLGGAWNSGLKGGIALRQANEQTAQLQQAQQMAQQYRSDVNDAMANPTPQVFAALAMKYPAQREAIKQGWDQLDTGQRETEGALMSQAYSALLAGKPDVAKQIVQDHVTALENSGKDATAAKNALGLIVSDPAKAQAALGFTLAHVSDPKDFIAKFGALATGTQTAQTTPAVVAQKTAEASGAQSDAVVKGVAAGNAQTATTLANEQAAANVRIAQIKPELDRLELQIRGADSETKRGELQLQRDKLNFELQQLQRTQGVAAQDSQNATTNALGTLQQIKDHPAFKSQQYGGTWSKIKGMIPGTERNALDGWIDSLKGQLSYQNLTAMKAASPNGASGLGALSEGEQRMLSNIAGNLNPDSADFPKQLAQVERFLQKAQSTVVARGQLPQQGEAFVMRHPVYGNVTEGQVNNLMKQFPGSTREQVIQFLQQTGGK